MSHLEAKTCSQIYIRTGCGMVWLYSKWDIMCIKAEGLQYRKWRMGRVDTEWCQLQGELTPLPSLPFPPLREPVGSYQRIYISDRRVRPIE